MAQNKIQITAENSREWLASTGFIFPTNGIELARFNMLFGDIDPNINGNEVDPYKIIKQSARVVKRTRVIQKNKDINQYKLVANNINKLPAHIIKLVKKSSNSQTGKNID